MLAASLANKIGAADSGRNPKRIRGEMIEEDTLIPFLGRKKNMYAQTHTSIHLHVCVYIPTYMPLRDTNNTDIPPMLSDYGVQKYFT